MSSNKKIENQIEDAHIAILESKAILAAADFEPQSRVKQHQLMRNRLANAIEHLQEAMATSEALDYQPPKECGCT